MGNGRWSSDDGSCSVVVGQGLDDSVEGDWSGPEDEGTHEACFPLRGGEEGSSGSRR